MAWKLEIGGVDKTTSIDQASGVEIELHGSERSTARFTTSHGYKPDLRAEVVIYDTDGVTAIFGGIVFSRDSRGIGHLMKTDVDCVDWPWYFDNVSMPGSMLTGTYTLLQVLQWIQTNLLAPRGFTLDPAQVTGPSWTVTGYTWERKSLSAFLRDNVGPASQGYVFYVTPAKVWGMQKADLTVANAPFTITDGSGTSQELQWKETSANYANKIILPYGDGLSPAEVTAGTGLIERILPTATGITDAATAQAEADGWLVALNQSPRTFEIDTITPGLAPGQVIAIVSTIRDTSTKALITRVGITLQTDEFWRYRAEAISGVYQGSSLDAWRGGGSGGGGGMGGIIVSAPPVGQALTKGDDTNVTLTLGGGHAAALLSASSITAGWTGQLAAARGGTGLGTYAVGDLLYASATTPTLARLADVAAGSYLRSGGVNTAPLWSTLILPNAATANQIVYATATNTYGGSANLTFNGSTLALTGAATISSTLGVTGVATFSAPAGAVRVGAFATGITASEHALFANNTGLLYVGVDDSTGSTFGYGNYGGVLRANSPVGLTIAAVNASSGDVRIHSRNALAVTFGASQLAAFTGAATIGGTLGVTGVTTLTGLLNANGGIAVDTTNFTVSGTTGAVHTAGDLDVATNKFTVAAATGNTLIAGTLGVTGVSTLTGLANLNGGLAMDTDKFTVADGTGNTNTQGYIGHPSYASQTTNWRITAGGDADFRYVFTDEMHAKVFVADLEQALAGGQIITKSVAMVGSAFTVPAAGVSANLIVRDLPSAANMAVFESGDYVVLRSFSRASGALTIADAVGVVTGYTDLAGGLQIWAWERLSGGNAGTMTAGTVIPVDALALDYGVTGNGYYEVNAIDGTYGANSPYAQVVTWATSPVAANRTVRARFGKLTGITSTANEFGLIAGTYAATNGQYFRASNSAFELHGITLKMWDGATEVIRLDQSVPSLALGSPLPSAYGTGVGIWMGKDGAAYKFRVGDPSGGRLAWDGTTLTAAGWTIGAATISATNISMVSGAANTARFEVGSSPNIAGINSTAAGSDIVFWAGKDHVDRATAPFRVTAAGALTGTSGAIGGWALGAASLSSTNISMVSGAANTARFEVGSSPNIAGINATSASSDIAFWAGKDHVDRATAPFRVTAAGALTATSGTIGGWSLSATSLTGGSVTLHSSDGVALAPTTSYAATNAYKWTNSGADTGNFGLVGLWSTGGGVSMKELSVSVTNTDTGNTPHANINLVAGAGSDTAQMQTRVLLSNPTARLVAISGANSTSLVVTATGVTIDQSLVMGAPTGGNKGAGTINATAVYDDNTLLTDWVFDLHYDGHSRDSIPVGGRLYSLSETTAITANERRLPWMPTRAAFEADRSLGRMVTNLWFGQEQQQLYIQELEARIAELEAYR